MYSEGILYTYAIGKLLKGGEQMYITDTIELRKIMVEKGINTINEFADTCGINRNTAGKILKGMEQPSALSMYRIAEGLKLKPSQAGFIFFSRNLRNV